MPGASYVYLQMFMYSYVTYVVHVCACIHLCLSVPHACRCLQISEDVGLPGIAATENCNPVDMGAVGMSQLGSLVRELSVS